MRPKSDNLPLVEIKLTLDPTGIRALTSEMAQKLNGEAQRAVQAFAPAAHAHAVELAGERLHGRRELFVENLTFTQEEAGTFVILLDGKARWIDDGMEPHDMKPDLLGSPKAKTSADGSRYLVVPFKHGPGKGPTTTTAPQQNLIDTVRSEMKRRRIPWGKIEKGPDGQPKQGLLHKFDLNDRPVRTGAGPGQGAGPIGKVMQGPTGIPLLQGVRVYQRKGADGTTKRSVMTFRTVSSKMGPNRWFHPGLKPVRIMEDTATWIQEQWDRVILPQVLEQVLGPAA